MILSLYKPQGVTPLALIQQLRRAHPAYAQTTIGYAGRLDPLAHGVLLLMTDETNKQREQYLGLKKHYNFSVLFGVITDTYDYLGLLKNAHPASPPDSLVKDIQTYAQEHIGTITQSYPPFSSKTINGKTLFKLAKKKQLIETTIPQRNVTIEKFDFLDTRTLTTPEMKKTINTHLRKIRGHFRQGKIRQQWKEYFELFPNTTYTLATFSIVCTSGTYVRALAHDMGQTFGCGAIAYEILRTQVGEYTVDEALKL